MIANAIDLLLSQHRFDLVYKYLYVKKPDNAFVRRAYLESIRAFNGYVEGEPSDGIMKDSPEKFIASFDRLIASIRGKGFDRATPAIPIGDNGEISDGAHRLVVAAALGLDVPLERDGRADLYDWRFFSSRGMALDIMDYGALEYVRLNPCAYVVNLHAVADPTSDEVVEKILGEYGFVYYKKELRPTYNGYVNLKKLSYGSFWERESWIGSPENGFAGAQMHARQSMGDGKNPLRVYVFICREHARVVEAKARIRDVFGVGNYSVHINDSRAEAICLAETYFNANSWQALNLRPFCFEDPRFDGLIDELKRHVSACGGRLEDVCATASTVLNAFGLRTCDDFDFLCRKGSGLEIQTEQTLSSVEDQWLRFYADSINDILDDPALHFYYRGLKFASADVIARMKAKRRSQPKDLQDIAMLKSLFHPSVVVELNILAGKALKALARFVYRKSRREDGLRRVRILGLIRFSYRRKAR